MFTDRIYVYFINYVKFSNEEHCYKNAYKSNKTLIKESLFFLNFIFK